MRAAPAVPPPGACVAVAGLSARWLAESARRAGWQVVALDVFGDADTRAAARHWVPVGVPGGAPRLDPTRLRAGLAEAAARHGAVAWFAGSGLEAAPALWDAGGAALLRIGMPRAAIEALRAPRRFFAALDRAGLAHPAVAWQRPPAAPGWLRKCAASCGGDGVWRDDAPPLPLPARAGASNLPRGAQACDPAAKADADANTDTGTGQRSGEASEADAGAGVYWQQELSGPPMSALALADGRRAHLVALNRLALQPTADRPFLYRGARGPVDAPALAAQARAALDVLVPAFGLRGLLSLDFIDHGGRAHWLEINPRPSATMQLHEAGWPDGLLAAHARACAGRLPPAPPAPPGLQGVDTWYAPAEGRVDARFLEPLPGALHLHDRPAPGARLRAGDPVCSIGLRAADDAALERGLAHGAALLADRWADRRPALPS